MTIKEFVYAGQSEIEAATGAPFKRAHVYETLAAAFGFSSLAALYTDQVFDEGSRHTAVEWERHLLGAIRRIRELGYPETVASALLLSSRSLSNQEAYQLARLNVC